MSATVTLPAREVPVIGEYEVVVVGGGPAGIMAATAAARVGRSTLLIERYGFLGGAGTMGGLSTFCGLHARVHGEDVRVIRGYADELLERLERLDGLSEPHLSVEGRIMAQAFDISAYKMAADDLVLASGAELLFHAAVQGLVHDDLGRIDGVVVESKSGAGLVRGRFFIDASGDGDVAAWAGAPFERSEHLLYPSLMFRINGVDPVQAGPAWKTIRTLMEDAEAAGTHSFPRKKPIVRPQRNPLEWRSNLTQLSNEDGSAIDGTDVRQLTRGEIQGRRQVRDTFAFIRERTPGFEDSYVVDIAPQIGIRETRRIVGPYQLTEQDVLGLRRLRRHHRRERVAGRGACDRRRRVPLRAGRLARLQPAALPDAGAPAGRQPPGRRALRLDERSAASPPAGSPARASSWARPRAPPPTWRSVRA
ncbi:FAD-dependent oxidoreductase [Microbacterium elymi]|uniref:FAD-dependent oxidoreductase n=1 Tax=Microbacterium elymi TaxID=2909587 RepID=A0ABY5NLZ8_9MICO|nr:FAD-dependent oxidoreductase [Microbacterium elymi]UUT36216.1 FAD-dependent oxidoreductase [Microbacterium elymi]